MTKQQRIPLEYLQKLVPISQLTHDNLLDLSNKIFVEELDAGRTLFKKGANDNYSYYLLAGDLELDPGDGNTKIISQRTQQARYPISHYKPRVCTARAKTPVKYFWVDNDFLDILLTWDQSASLVVSEIAASGESEATAEDSDWMTNILRSTIFHRIPPGNIQSLLMKMETMQYKNGEQVIQQDDEGDYYYYINSGRCAVSRVMTEGESPVMLAELAAGSSFGEEALISGAKRNATITMLADGELIRLAKDDFNDLLTAPVVKTVNYADAEKMVKNGAVWLDVRLESEHENDGLAESVNVPLAELRNEIASLAHDTHYIIYCDTGRRSASAAYLLSEKDIDASVLEDGLMALQQDITDE